jgi:hypothetical protein
MVPGFVGKPKGIKQILWERGLWRPGMVRSKTDAEIKRILLQDGVPPADDMYYDKVLAACPDFALEKSALQEMVEARGHILIYSVACHPELAGVGMEYGWGCSKKYFRHENLRRGNSLAAKDFKPLILESLSEKVLHKDRLRKFERRAWTYKQMYYGLHLNSQVTGQAIDITYDFLEKQMKSRKKEHRNIEKIEREWLKRN